MATVDVIMPAYNSARFLPAALDSVLGQTFADWQIVLVDDGSTDNTAQVVASYQRLFGAKLTYILQANGGPSAARNRAVNASNSEFLAFLDADDIWLPNRLEESVRALRERPKAGIAYGLITEIDAAGNRGSTWPGNKNGISGKIAPYIYMRTSHLPCLTTTIRRQCIEEAGYFDERMRATEDRDLWFRIALRHEVAFIPAVLAYYRVSEGSASSDQDRMLSAQMHFIEKHYGALGCGWRARQIARAGVYKERAWRLHRLNRRSIALKSIFRSLVLYPFDLGTYRTAATLILNRSA